MSSPHTLTARWGLNYVLLIGVIVIIAVVAIGLGYYSKKLPLPSFVITKKTKRVRRRVRPTRTVSERTVEHATVSKEKTTVPAPVTPTGPQKALIFCPQCGAKVMRDSKFCKECGAKIS
jgi:hypothetical protein